MGAENTQETTIKQAQNIFIFIHRGKGTEENVTENEGKMIVSIQESKHSVMYYHLGGLLWARVILAD